MTMAPRCENSRDRDTRRLVPMRDNSTLPATESLRTCSIQGCEGMVKARGYCRKHYRRLLKHGDPLIKRTSKPVRPPIIHGNVANITLTQGKVAVIDLADLPSIGSFHWSYCACGYAARNVQGKRVYLHRSIIPVPEGMEIDHVDGDKLNNRRSNIRICTPSQNGANRGKLSTNTSGFKGVIRGRSKLRENWCARIWAQGRQIYIGTFETPEDAGTAYFQRARELFGEFARAE